MKVREPFSMKDIESLFKYRNALNKLIASPKRSGVNFNYLNDLKSELNMIIGVCEVIKITALTFYTDKKRGYYVVSDTEQKGKIVGCYSNLRILSLDLMIDRYFVSRLVKNNQIGARYQIRRTNKRIDINA